VMTGFGYGDLDLEAVERALDGRDDVESWTVLGLTNIVSVDGEPVLSVIGRDERAGVDFSMVEGRLPRQAGEVALGSRTAAERGVGVGDEVTLTAEEVEPVRATVTGIVVLPPLGQFEADRTAPGTGMVLPAAFAPPGELAGLFTFVGIDLAPEVPADAAYADLRDDFATWDHVGAPALEYREPVRPAEILNVQSMRAVPLVVGGLLAATAVVGLAVAVVMSVRARRRELAILRALGFTGAQVRRSVRVQTVVTLMTALVVGVPLGIAAGRVAWRVFASRLGVVTDPSTPVWWIVAVVVGSLGVALLAAAVPARVAARIRPATVLRAE
jgi:FtsX-like permease family